VFTDRVSGVTEDRPELTRALEQLRDGDTLVVWRLDRLGRSLRHLIDVVTGLAGDGVGFRSEGGVLLQRRHPGIPDQLAHVSTVAIPVPSQDRDTLKVERESENPRPGQTPFKISFPGSCQKGPDTTRQPGLPVTGTTRLRTPPHQLTTARRGNPRRAPCGRP